MNRDVLNGVLTASAVAIVAHSVVRHYGRAVLVAIIAAPFICTLENMVPLPSPAKFSWLPFVFGEFAVCAVLPAAVIGLPFLVWRRLRQSRSML